MLQYLQHQQHLNVYATVETADNCPLDGCCLKQCFIYKAEVYVDNDYKIYYGAVEGDFKFRYNNHTTPLEIGIMNMILSFQNIYGN